MSRIRPQRLSRRETLLIKTDCADVLARAAAEVEHARRVGHFDILTGHGAAMAIVAAFRDAAPDHLQRSRLQRKGAR